ncbi:hypothetical protein BDU57DRAFT_224051 [Ampelomyces quisqualis]|uniref:Uncharacterized protein n=1 Tax=Ampelomyces quisqualis TaxID=50730 RepID=A0A6A5QLL4_AMPQU|nr:hypothetical protein BDU57DRAFT_224051 [Ampelomyces quisqualis]
MFSGQSRNHHATTYASGLRASIHHHQRASNHQTLVGTAPPHSIHIIPQTDCSSLVRFGLSFGVRIISSLVQGFYICSMYLLTYRFYSLQVRAHVRLVLLSVQSWWAC